MDRRLVLYEYAMQFVGLPYRWGGSDPIGGFDCSGLCIELLKACGVLERNVDLNAKGLWMRFSSNTIDAPTFGTFSFYGTSADNISHIGFCLNPSMMLEAGGGDSTTTTREAAEKKDAFIRVRPITSRKDLIGFKHPPYPWKG